MNEVVINKLNAAKKSGEVIRIVYNGGSQPGTVREVSPIDILENEMRARDIATGIVKTFILSKIQFPNSESKLLRYDPNAAPISKPDVHQTIKEVFISKVAELESLGWKVESEMDSISLFLFFNNGKPRKTPAIRLSFYEFVDESYYDPDKDDFVGDKRKSTRPYRVESPSFSSARTFANLSSAVELFLQEANTHAPKNAP